MTHYQVTMPEGGVAGESRFVAVPAAAHAAVPVTVPVAENDAVRLLTAEVARLRTQVARLVSSNEHTAVFSQH